jgi:hypothetical protein
MWTLDNWERYSDKPAPLFKTRKEAEAKASALRTLRAWVTAVKVGD